MDHIFRTSKSKFIYALIKFLKTTVSKRKVQAGDLVFSIMLICIMSFLKGTSYSGTQGNIYVKQEDQKTQIDILYGNIIALDKGILLKQSDNIITFTFNDKIVKIEYKIHTNSFSEKLLNLL